MRLHPRLACITAVGRNVLVLIAVLMLAIKCSFMFERTRKRSHTIVRNVRKAFHGPKIWKFISVRILVKNRTCVRWKGAIRRIRIHRIVSSTRAHIQRRNHIFVSFHRAQNVIQIHRRCENTWKHSSTLCKRWKSTIRKSLDRHQFRWRSQCRYSARNRPRSHVVNRPNIVCHWVTMNRHSRSITITKRANWPKQRIHHHQYSWNRPYSYQMTVSQINVYRQCTQNGFNVIQLRDSIIWTICCRAVQILIRQKSHIVPMTRKITSPIFGSKISFAVLVSKTIATILRLIRLLIWAYAKWSDSESKWPDFCTSPTVDHAFFFLLFVIICCFSNVLFSKMRKKFFPLYALDFKLL